MTPNDTAENRPEDVTPRRDARRASAATEAADVMPSADEQGSRADVTLADLDPARAALHDEEHGGSGNAYEVPMSRGRSMLLWTLAALGIAISIAASFTTAPEVPTIWGLLPIVLFALLAILGMDIVVAAVVSAISGVVLAHLDVLSATKLMGDSMSEMITMIGLIIMLGAGVGEVLKVTGVAQQIVAGVMRMFGERSKTALVLGIMISCLVLVTSLGTLAGAIAIAAPILIPIAARAGYTKSATAAMMLIGGGAGLALAPFAGSNVAIMDAAEISYLEYLLYGAGPIALVSLACGLPVVAYMQRRTREDADYYLEEETGVGAKELPRRAGLATSAFVVTLVLAVVFATISAAGTTFPLLALPALALVTGLAAGMSVGEIIQTIYRGCASMVSMFIYFWLLAILFSLIDLLAPFDIILETFGPQLQNASPFLFTVIIALLGWVGIPGATAAQVVLMDEVFGPVAAALGVGVAPWTVVLLFGSKADTYGPFPNGNMVGVMGLARSNKLKNIMIAGWIMLIPITIVYMAMLFFMTM